MSNGKDYSSIDLLVKRGGKGYWYLVKKREEGGLSQKSIIKQKGRGKMFQKGGRIRNANGKEPRWEEGIAGKK